MATEYIFFRHGQSFGNLTGEFYDGPEIGLTDKGILQAKQLGLKLQEYDLENVVVYSSPWKRARDTCAIALEAGKIKHKEILYDERLHERIFAGVVGKRVCLSQADEEAARALSKEYVSAAAYKKIWRYGSSASELFGVEPLNKVKERLESFLEETSRKHPNTTVLLSSHGGLGRMFYGLLVEWPKHGDFGSIPFLQNCEILKCCYS